MVEQWAAVTDAGREGRVLVGPASGEVQLLEPFESPDGDELSGEGETAMSTPSCCPVAWPTPTPCAPSAAAVAFRSSGGVKADKPIAAICHAPADADRDRHGARAEDDVLRLAEDRLRNAGATWVDEEVVVDGNLVTSRKPDDIPAFNDALLEALHHGIGNCAGGQEAQGPPQPRPEFVPWTRGEQLLRQAQGTGGDAAHRTRHAPAAVAPDMTTHPRRSSTPPPPPRRAAAGPRREQRRRGDSPCE